MKTAHKYGYGIVDKFSQPWWGEGCVCQDREPMDDICKHLNNPHLAWIHADWKGPTINAPYRVVRLFWQSSTRRSSKTDDKK